jgi:BMFP domain-containing protein YqiC
MRLLEKIEELLLYTFTQREKLEAQQQQIEVLQQQNATLEARLAALEKAVGVNSSTARP